MEVMNPMKLAPNQSGCALSFAAKAPEIAKKPVPKSSKMYCICIFMILKGKFNKDSAAGRILLKNNNTMLA